MNQEVAKLANNAIELTKESAKIKEQYHQILTAIRSEAEIILTNFQRSILSRDREKTGDKLKHLVKCIKDVEITLNSGDITHIEKMTQEINDYRNVLSKVAKEYGPQLYYDESRKVLAKYK